MSIKSLRTGYKGISVLAGNLPPGDFESIQTVTVASTAATIEFTDIPQTYTHLQVRYLARENTGGGTNAANQLQVRFNTDSGNNYSLHRLFGNGASVSADGYASSAPINSIRVSGLNGSGATGSSFAGGIIDILDYKNTNKNTTVRSLCGGDLNDTNGFIFFNSGAWYNTNAVNRITITNLSAVNFAINSHFALYGIRG
jgi:hypothetical protein